MLNNIFGEKLRRGKKVDISDDNPGLESSVPKVFCGRIAVYEDVRSRPAIQELAENDLFGFIEKYSTLVHQSSREAGGNISFSIIRELVENFIHASFTDVLVSVDQSGNRLRFADHGPGISDPEKAFQRGFSTASSSLTSYIKGVGSGLSICKDIIESVGGGIHIESNLGWGTVVTIWMPSTENELVVPDNLSDIPQLDLGSRQKRVLFLVTELGSAGPSQVAKELRISLSSAYRDLRVLETGDLLKINEDGKRSLTALGVKYLSLLTKPD